MGMHERTRTVLFLCTGNYYRSRFTELLFNSLASPLDLGWTAISRGIAMELGIRNVGPVSPYALRGLKARGIRVEQDIRLPMPLQEQDLAQADLIIALNEKEHLPYLETRFPGWEDKVEYWHISDLDDALADDAMREMEREVRSLLRRLSQGSV
jgi:protein-tyrosine phosphatase